MQPKALRHKKGPEAEIQRQFKLYLLERDWFVKETHGNMYQSGFPDMYADHPKYGARWVEMKNPSAYCFTPAQIATFPKINLGVWIIVAATEEEYRKLFLPSNWWSYLDIWRRQS